MNFPSSRSDCLRLCVETQIQFSMADCLIFTFDLCFVMIRTEENRKEGNRNQFIIKMICYKSLLTI
ncbi:hypothetical protein HanXRQr2_Chr12g0538131 [Helianthus annuus]|uniref:Uncharacterized protein n=1 Tax=Helianthus annuus TaxID=4232 RepID=A0A251T1A5_HELAN|nr:hypothetical protein HanXRQr2_Chr12g0538131 [Helianthus annuus]KAJ0862419.1 hypothetical protein HanPSC8_Chr12g0517951 [Helianthus annuus]